MKNKSTTRLGWPIIFLVLIIFLIGTFIIYFPSYSKYRELQTEAEELQLELNRLEKDIQALRQEKQLIENDKNYLETVIRSEMGLVQPGEVVYEFNDKPSQGAPTLPIASSQEEAN